MQGVRGSPGDFITVCDISLTLHRRGVHRRGEGGHHLLFIMPPQPLQQTAEV